MEQARIKERRLKPRRDIPIRAVVVGDRQRRVLVTRDIGAYGAFFKGEYPVKPGTRLHLRLDISMEEDNIPSVLNLDVYVTVIRIEYHHNGKPKGFAAQWIRASSVGDVIALKEFLKSYLQVAGGFVHVLKPEAEGEVPIYSFTFPQPGQAHASMDQDTQSEDLPNDTGDSDPQPLKTEESKEQDDHPQKPTPLDVPTRVYATLPIHYTYGGKKFEGTAVKLRADGIRIDTSDTIPDVYSPVQIELPVTTPGKEGVLKINATVSLVKKNRRDTGGQFEIKFSLKNSPAVLEGYRGILRTLQESIAQS